MSALKKKKKKKAIDPRTDLHDPFWLHLCTDNDHVNPSVLGPSASCIGDGVKVLWARQYRVKPLMQNIA